MGDISPRPTNATEPWPAVPPGEAATFEVGDDGTTYYTETTIDDFSPLITFSNVGSDWVSPLTDSELSAVRPVVPRKWLLGTYRRTETKNATITIEFWGSEIQLWGDTGPIYGTYTLAVDNSTPSLQTAFRPDRPTGQSHLMHTIRNLTEAKHELIITSWGTREGLNEGPSFLFDFAVVKQKVGVPGRLKPQTFDIQGESLTGLRTNGTWSSGLLQGDIQPGEGGIKPAVYVERPAFWTTENLAVLTHRFRGTGIQVFGGRNATHGSYRATLTNTNSSTTVHSQIYNATTPCDFPGSEGSEKRSCEWRGSVLKFAAANLDPDIGYGLTLQNLHRDDKSVFEIDMIRVIDLREKVGDDGSSSGGGSAIPSSTNSPVLNDDDSAAHRLFGPDRLTNLLMVLLILMVTWRAFRR